MYVACVPGLSLCVCSVSGRVPPLSSLSLRSGVSVWVQYPYKFRRYMYQSLSIFSISRVCSLSLSMCVYVYVCVCVCVCVWVFRLCSYLLGVAVALFLPHQLYIFLTVVLEHLHAISHNLNEISYFDTRINAEGTRVRTHDFWLAEFQQLLTT